MKKLLILCTLAACGEYHDLKAPPAVDLHAAKAPRKKLKLSPVAGAIKSQDYKNCAESPLVGAWLSKDNWEFFLKSNCLGDYSIHDLNVKSIVWYYDPEEKIIAFHEDTKEQKILDSCQILNIGYMPGIKIATDLNLNCDNHGMVSLIRDLALENGAPLPKLDEFFSK